MNKSFCAAAALCLSVLLGGWLRAQTPLGADQLPPGPLIVESMPDMAQWSIDYTYKDGSNAQTEAAVLANYKKLAQQDPAVAKAMADPHFLYALAPPRPLRKVITKTGDIRHEEVQLERDFKSETWSFGGFRVERRPDAAQLVPAVMNTQAKDLPEFSWISKESFQGVKKVGAVDCLAFQKEIDGAAILDPETFTQRGSRKGASLSRAVAYVDVKTRYPVALVLNDDPLRYTIMPSPTAKLVVPDDFAAVAREAKARLDAVTKPLSPP
jgi:hypothetical protein